MRWRVRASNSRDAAAKLDLRLVPATEGNSGYDISALLKETGNVTLDAGLVNTASCTSASREASVASTS